MKTVVLLFCVLMGLGGMASAETNYGATSTLLSVRGEAQLKVAPDQVTIVLGVTTQDKTAKRALSENTHLMTKVMKALRKQGLVKTEITTQRFGVQPIWSSRPRVISSGEQWVSSITGYRVNNTVKIVTTQLALVGDVINASTVAGANQVQSITFGLANPRQYREQAITRAIKNAKTDASSVARASELKISGVKTIRLDNAAASTERVQAANFSRSALSEANSTPPINSGDITVRASVSVEYLLSAR